MFSDIQYITICLSHPSICFYDYYYYAIITNTITKCNVSNVMKEKKITLLIVRETSTDIPITSNNNRAFIMNRLGNQI